MRLADEAHTLAGGSGDDFSTLAVVLCVRARVASARADHAEGVQLARAAVTLVDPTEYAGSQADARRILGDLLLEAGRPDEAGEALAKALALYEQKGSTVLAKRTRALLQRTAIPV